MPKEFGRNARVSSQLQKELALVLQRDLKDPRLGFITVNEVVMAKDLSVAKIYVTVLNVDEQGKRYNVKLLNQLAPQIRHDVAKRMRLRHISELRFFYDNSFDTGMRVAQLLNEDKANVQANLAVDPDAHGVSPDQDTG